MWAGAAGVMAFAAAQSYTHIRDLGLAHGGGWTAWLLPLSVDMLILVGELMLIHEADGKGHRFPLGWVLVGSGIAATLAANVTYGLQYGVIGAVIWGWPAYSFTLAAAGMVAVVKRATPAPAVVPPVAHHDTSPAAPAVPAVPRKRAAPKPAGGKQTVAELAAAEGVSVRTWYRRHREA